MGSGHFLVSLVDFIADRVLEAVADAPLIVPFADEEHPYESPLIERIASIRERILQLAARDRWKLVTTSDSADRVTTLSSRLPETQTRRRTRRVSQFIGTGSLMP